MTEKKVYSIDFMLSLRESPLITQPRLLYNIKKPRHRNVQRKSNRTPKISQLISEKEDGEPEWMEFDGAKAERDYLENTRKFEQVMKGIAKGTERYKKTEFSDQFHDLDNIKSPLTEDADLGQSRLGNIFAKLRKKSESDETETPQNKLQEIFGNIELGSKPTRNIVFASELEKFE